MGNQTTALNPFTDLCVVRFATISCLDGKQTAIRPSKTGVRILSINEADSTIKKIKIVASSDESVIINASPEGVEPALNIAEHLGGVIDGHKALVTAEDIAALCEHSKVAIRPSKTGIRIYAVRDDRVFKLRVLKKGEMQFKSWMVGDEEPQIEEGDALGADIKDDDDVNIGFFKNMVMNYSVVAH